MTNAPTTNPDPDRLLPPPSDLRPALDEALRRVRILRGLLRLSESVARSSPTRETRQEGASHVAR
jgi:hypothetical protein